MKKLYGGRAMLNLPGHHGTGAIAAEVENTEEWKPGCNRRGKEIRDSYYEAEPDYVFLLSDCSRSIDLQLDWETEEERENSLHKVDTMIEILKQFREGLVLEQKRFTERQELILANKDKEKEAE